MRIRRSPDTPGVISAQATALIQARKANTSDDRKTEEKSNAVAFALNCEMLIGIMAKKASLSRMQKAEVAGKYRNFPKHSLEATLVVAQKIQDEMGGKPMNRLLLADALGLSPSSSNFREILSSSYKYGLTEGTEKADQISLSAIGDAATGKDAAKRLAALRSAALRSPVFGQFFQDFGNKKVPSAEMLPKVLNTSYSVPKDVSLECASLVNENGRFVEIIREIGGSPHILLEADVAKLGQEDAATDSEEKDGPIERGDTAPEPLPKPDPKPDAPPTNQHPQAHKPIFVAHGKNKSPFNSCRLF